MRGRGVVINRRGFLVGSAAGLGSLAVGVLGAVPPARASTAASSADFVNLRSWWRDHLTGGSFDSSDPDFAPVLAKISSAASAAIAKIDDSQNRTRVFTDYDLTDSNQLWYTYKRLRDMAVAYATDGSDWHQDGAVVTAVLDGLASVNDLAYNSEQIEYGGWWNFEIGCPEALLDTCVLIYDELPSADMEQYLAAVNHFVPDPAWQFNVYNSTVPGRVPLASVGANRVDLCRVAMLSGALGESDDRVALASQRLGEAITYAHPDPSAFYGANQGLYLDGSYLYQGYVPYTGSYGEVWLIGMAGVLGALGGSPWQVSSAHQDIVTGSVENAFAPVIVDGVIDGSVMGRAVSRHAVNAVYFGDIFDAIMQLTTAVDSVTADRWRAICLGWLQRNTYSDIRVVTGTSVGRIAAIKGLQDDPSLTPAAEPAGHRLFPVMARAVHRGTGWAYAISMASDRVSNYDYGSGENEKGFHTGSGMTYLHNADVGQFEDDFWPTVDLYRLPGTTIDQKTLPNGAGGSDYGKTLAANAWAGGVVLDNRFGAEGQDLHGVASTMTAKKSWFSLDDRIVALGAAINGGSGQPVITTMENRNLHQTGLNELTVDGVAQPATQGWSASFPAANWAHLADVAGYVLLDGPRPIEALREERSGQWSDINTTGPTGVTTRRYVTLTIDHGPSPVDGSYAYLVKPGAEAAEMADLAAQPGVVILANSAAVQAIRTAEADVMLANFFAEAELDSALPGVVADGPCSVIVRWTAGGLDVAVSDPTAQRDSVVVDLVDVHVAGATGDASVQVADTADGTRVTVDTSDRDGRSYSTALSLDPGASVIVGSVVGPLPSSAGPVYAIGASAPQTVRLSEGSSLYASGTTFGGAVIAYRPHDVVLRGCHVAGAVLVTAYSGQFDVGGSDVAGVVRATRQSR